MNCMSCLYILEVNPLLVSLFANILSHSMGFHFVYGFLCCAKAKYSQVLFIFIFIILGVFSLLLIIAL